MANTRVGLLVAVLSLGGCGDNEEVVVVDARIDAVVPADAQVCSTLTLPAAVEVQNVATIPPVSTGGTIVPGAYTVTAVTVYTGVGGASGASGIMFSAATSSDATTFRYVEKTGAAAPVRVAGTYTQNGTQLVTTNTCPDTVTTTFAIDATPTQFLTYQLLPGPLTRVTTYTKQ